MLSYLGSRVVSIINEFNSNINDLNFDYCKNFIKKNLQYLGLLRLPWNTPHLRSTAVNQRKCIPIWTPRIPSDILKNFYRSYNLIMKKCQNCHIYCDILPLIVINTNWQSLNLNINHIPLSILIRSPPSTPLDITRQYNFVTLNKISPYFLNISNILNVFCFTRKT